MTMTHDHDVGLDEPVAVARDHTQRALSAVADALDAHTGGHARRSGHAAAHQRPDEPADSALLAARVLTEAVRTELTEHVRGHRATGVGWQRIGELLDLATLADVLNRPLAEVTFEHVTGVSSRETDRGHWRLDSGSFTWTCAECDTHIREYGPYPDAPRDGGHEPGCARADG